MQTAPRQTTADVADSRAAPKSETGVHGRNAPGRRERPSLPWGLRSTRRSSRVAPGRGVGGHPPKPRNGPRPASSSPGASRRSTATRSTSRNVTRRPVPLSVAGVRAPAAAGRPGEVALERGRLDTVISGLPCNRAAVSAPPRFPTADVSDGDGVIVHTRPEVDGRAVVRPNPRVSGGCRAPVRPRWHRRRSAGTSQSACSSPMVPCQSRKTGWGRRASGNDSPLLAAGARANTRVHSADAESFLRRALRPASMRRGSGVGTLFPGGISRPA